MTHADPPTAPALFIFVRRRPGLAGALLMALVGTALALDFFRSDLLGPHLIGLRLIYAVLALLIVGYLWVVSTAPAPGGHSQPK